MNHLTLIVLLLLELRVDDVVVPGRLRSAGGLSRSVRSRLSSRVLVEMLGHRVQGLFKSEEARNSMMHSVVGTYKLLLIGGLWSDWLDNGACEGFSEHVERIVHVSTRQVGDAINIVETAGSVFIFHTGIARARNSNNSLLINTVNDVIWPIVLAASSDTRIHLSNPNPHLEDLVRGSNLLSEKWTSIGMAKVFSSAVVRLHGFGVNTARVNAHQICISESGNFCRLNLTAEPDCLFSTPYSPPLISTFLRNNSVLESVTVILQLGFSDFTVGRDGSCCIVYRGKKRRRYYFYAL